MTYIELRNHIDDIGLQIAQLEDLLTYDELDHENTIEQLDYLNNQLRLLITEYPLYTSQYIVAMHINRNN
jgi:hypothetical protein